MYEMYPDAWPTTGERQQQVEQERPRRRARKQHSVLPPVLAGAQLPRRPPATG